MESIGPYSRSLPEIIMPYEVIPMAFHGYTSIVTDRILEVGFRTGDAISEFRDYLFARFTHAGIRCVMDNKVVYECERNGRTIFIGFYDNKMSIGFEMRKL